MKDGKCLCLGCGRRVDGLLNPKGHAAACPVSVSAKQGKK